MEKLKEPYFYAQSLLIYQSKCVIIDVVSTSALGSLKRRPPKPINTNQSFALWLVNLNDYCDRTKINSPTVARAQLSAFLFVSCKQPFAPYGADVSI